MNPILDRLNEIEEAKRDEFRYQVVKFIESYGFLTHIVQYDDTKLEKLFVICKFMVNQDVLKDLSTQMPELKGDVSLQWYRLEKTHEGDVSVINGNGSLIAKDSMRKAKNPDVLTTLSAIVKLFNDKYGDLEITDADRIMVDDWLKSLENNPSLREIAQSNEFDDFYRTYAENFKNKYLISLPENKYLVQKIFADAELKNKIMITAAKRYHEWANANNLPPITPQTPYENRLHFRETIRNCNDSIYWIDRYIGKDGLEFLMDSFNQQTVKEIKILTSLYNNEYQINELLNVRFVRYQVELAKKGIFCEMRVLASKNAYDHVSHDRFIIGANVKYNVPSFTTIIKGGFSEIKKTGNPIPFIEYWNDKDALDIVSDWEKIKAML